MYRETLKVKNKKLNPNSFYRTWKMYDGIEKGVRMKEMTKQEVMVEALFRIVDKLSPKDRLGTFFDLAKIYKRLENIEVIDEKDSDEMNAISEVVGSYCNICGNNCTQVTDEVHDESFIVCNHGSQWKNEKIRNEMIKNGEHCKSYGIETDGIQYFVMREKI